MAGLCGHPLHSGALVRAVSSSGVISTVAGTGTASYSPTDPNGDNGPVRLYYIIISYIIIPYPMFFSVRQIPPLSTIPMVCMETPMGIYSYLTYTTAEFAWSPPSLGSSPDSLALGFKLILETADRFILIGHLPPLHLL
jgi:hypothetical protein